MYSSKSSNVEVNPIETGIVVCTIEKANALVLRLIDEENLGMLSCLIVDELHMVRCACSFVACEQCVPSCPLAHWPYSGGARFCACRWATIIAATCSSCFSPSCATPLPPSHRCRVASGRHR